MMLPDGRPMILDDGVFVEAPASGGRIVLWVRGEHLGDYQHWDRVGTVAHAGITAEWGICTVAASTVPTRQWVGGSIGGLIRRLGGSKANRSWTLPVGKSADQCGPRRTDLVLAWGEDDSEPIDEVRIHARWGAFRQIRPIGRNLSLICGVESERPRVQPRLGPEPGPHPQGSPRQLAERVLASAREAGDVRSELAASVDLALACLKERDINRAGELLEESLAGSRRIGDRGLEASVLLDLGLVVLEAGRPAVAREVLGRALIAVREAGDHYAEKLAIERLGHAQRHQGDHSGALGHFERALRIAVDLGDASHEADLLWHIAIEYADLGHRGRAGEHARAAVDRMRRLGRPQAEWFAHHLDEFQSGNHAGPSRPWDGPGSFHLDASIDTNALTTLSPPVTTNGPGPLRMALNATSSMAKFLGSGFNLASQEAHRARTEICASCEHHTGLRCRVCGCFTAAKARLAHERCPIGKWTA